MLVVERIERIHVGAAHDTTLRAWLSHIAGANSLFGELVMKLSKKRPHLIGIPNSVLGR